jgi:hypothetical protein
MTSDKSRKHPNADERRALKVASIADFVRKYQRKAQKRVEPNDRRHDVEIERSIKRMHPLALDRLLRDDDE